VEHTPVILKDFSDMMARLVKQGESADWLNYLWDMALYPGVHEWERQAEELAKQRHADSTKRTREVLDSKKGRTFGAYQAPKTRQGGQSED
jgi:hypothetical protein